MYSHDTSPPPEILETPAVERERPISLVVVDDEPLIRVALAQALKAEGVDLVGEATDGEAAIELVVDLRPDVVLTDIRLPGISGVEVIERLGLLAPASRVLVLARTEQNRVVEAIIAGASGYILKTAPPEAIVAAVRATAAGDCVLSPQIAGTLLERIRERDMPVVDGMHVLQEMGRHGEQAHPAALAVRSMTACAGTAARLTVEYLIAQSELLGC